MAGCRGSVKSATVRTLLPLFTLLALLFLMLSPAPNVASSCATSYTFNKQKLMLTQCTDLSAQGATLAWNYLHNNTQLRLFFSGTAPSSGGWVGFGINPDKLSMSGTQTFIAFQASNGSNILPYDVTKSTKRGSPLACTPISLQVNDSQVEITSSGTAIAMLVTLQLPLPGGASDLTSINLVWNRGDSVTNFQPGSHGFSNSDLSALTTLDLSYGSGSGGGSSSSRTAKSSLTPQQILKNRHGILNTVGWGILLPVGVLVARYLRFADPAWFYLHVAVQMAGYVLGVAGWATGIQLGNESVGVVYRKHRWLGVAVFVLATIQVGAILVRPNKEHKRRNFWNAYHYTLGATILTIGILNIFYGFDILSPPNTWRRAYVILLVALAIVAATSELFLWIHHCVCRQRRRPHSVPPITKP